MSQVQWYHISSHDPRWRYETNGV